MVSLHSNRIPLPRLMALGSTESTLPWCGVFSFDGGSYLYNCDTTLALGYSVESLADWYRTAVGSTLTDEVDSSSEGTEESTTVLIIDSRSTSARPFPMSTDLAATSTPARRVLSGAAIGGIAGGGAVLILGTAAIITTAWCCLRRRRQKDHQAAAAAQALVPRPPAVFDPASDMQPAPAYHQIHEVPATKPAAEPWELPIKP